MQSFRTELENPVVEQDIIELEKKIRLFHQGQMPEDKFKSLRLARGIYGQRQQGVQMIRIKLPYGKMTTQQLKRIADISDEFSTGNLHLTTRQDIQIHFVSLDKTPELWYKLELDDITIREACGNTVRNITASPMAGIDPDEPFDITPYAHAAFEYFLRNPVCQDMGRKFKISFSSSEKDSAYSFMHDLGVVPKIQLIDGKEVKGFKVLVGGGLGAQPFHAKVAFEFLPAEDLIAYTEAVLRVFDRHGERSSRHKARIKYLIDKIGMEQFTELVKNEFTAIKATHVPIEYKEIHTELPAADFAVPVFTVEHPEIFEAWKKTNVFAQKQSGYFGAFIKITTGNISSETARLLADTIKKFAGNDLRVTVNQGLLVKFIKDKHLSYFYSLLEQLNLADPGFDTVADVTSCPGTDTCNLGISNSTGIAQVLENIITEEYPELIFNKDIKIKISGCMNSCGQHGMASIGFHGSSLKAGNKVLPALQVLLGGGNVGDGVGRMAEKIIKLPSKRIPQALRAILNDYFQNAEKDELFNAYYDRQGKNYFYALLKPFADLTALQDEDYIDWNKDEAYSTAIGVGECAGVMIDLVATLLFEAEEKLAWASQSFEKEIYADAIYHAYSAMVSTAKALLLDKEVACNTHIGIINDFDKHFAAADFGFDGEFASSILQINQQQPAKEFAKKYLQQASTFIEQASVYRTTQVTETANS
jgi:sulfite reductase (ferredoxin)